MEQADLYIRKIIAFLICSILFLVAQNIVPWYIELPVCILSFGVLTSLITKEKPRELFNYKRTEAYFEKGGLRDLLRILISLLAFIHDLGVWLIWGVFQIYILFIDILYFLKTVIFWIVHATIWFLRLFVPFWQLVYWYLIHYLIKWPWWIYRNNFNNIKYAYKPNIIWISLTGTFIVLFIIQIFYFFQVLLEIDGLIFVGILLALLPLTWVFGEIASLRGRKYIDMPFTEVRGYFMNGAESVRAILFYLTFFVILLAVQVCLNLVGLITDAGLILIGIALDVNLLISLIILLLAILVLLGVFVLPTFRVYNNFSETTLKDTFKLLKCIIRRFLHYIFSLLSSAVFGIVVILLPSLAAIIMFYSTITVKNLLIENKIRRVQKERAYTDNKIKAEELAVRIEDLQQVKRYPSGLEQEMKHRQNVLYKLRLESEDLSSVKADLIYFEQEYKAEIESIDKRIKDTRNNFAINKTRLENLAKQKKKLDSEFSQYRAAKQIEIARLQANINSLETKLRHLPVVFFLSGFFYVIIFTLILSFYFGYLANVLFTAYVYKNDNSTSYWTIKIGEISKKDIKQPLLSTTLNIVILGLLMILIFDEGFHSILKTILSLFKLNVF